MSDVADLLMPKLGLTMTEGTVARWVVAPGARFARGDAIVVIETDKIASELEAPAGGELVELSKPEGSVVPVGATIARWKLDGAPAQTQVSGVSVTDSKSVAPVSPADAPHVRTSATLKVDLDATRVVATPYARRLAKEAAIDLGAVAGTGPRGRIKAADVALALDARASGALVEAPQPLASTATRTTRQRSALSFVTADVDVGALREIDKRLAGSRDRTFERTHYLALACIKAFDAEGRASPRLGVDSGCGQRFVIDSNARDTLSAIAARFEHGAAALDVDGGDIAVFMTNGRTRLFAPALPDGWRMSLGVGGVRAVRDGGDEIHEMTLALTYDAAESDHVAAVRLLDRIAALLEEPFHLLAG